jgi:hypothetical protein
VCRVRFALLPNTKHAYYFSASRFPKKTDFQSTLQGTSVALNI